MKRFAFIVGIIGLALHSCAPVSEVAPSAIAPGTVFRDCPECPEMVVIPAGFFMMGSPSRIVHNFVDDQGPQHPVTIQNFAMAKFEVTFAEWDACAAGGGCNGYLPFDEGWGRGKRPVINVSWDDARAYVRWLSKTTGKRYRLPSEADWEYAARAGTTTPYYFGQNVSSSQANFGLNKRKTESVGSYAPNDFGLFDVHGNVGEWVEDCWHGSYAGAPTDGGAWTNGGNCSSRVLRSGSWSSYRNQLRSAYRQRYNTGVRLKFNGFRVARKLP